MVRLRFNIIIIVIIVLVYSAEKLNLSRTEVVDVAKFVEYYPEHTGDIEDDGERIGDENYFTIEREFEVKNGSYRVLTQEEIEAEVKKEEEARIREEEEKNRRTNILIIKKHTVTEKENIKSIISKYGITEDVLRYHNPKIQKELKAGEVLLIPGENFIIHKVIKNEVISKIASRYKIKEQDIRSYNYLTSNNIRAGQNLYIKDPDLRDILKEQAKIAERKKEEEERKKEEEERKKIEVQAKKASFGNPVKLEGITSPFGNRRHPVLKRYVFHTGVDLKAKYVPLKASQDGRVTFAGYKTGYGKIIIISHRDNFETRYAHLNKIKVKEGDKVTRGQIIGQTGNTGRSTGPHLHFEIRKNDKPINPMNHLKR